MLYIYIYIHKMDRLDTPVFFPDICVPVYTETKSEKAPQRPCVVLVGKWEPVFVRRPVTLDFPVHQLTLHHLTLLGLFCLFLLPKKHRPFGMGIILNDAFLKKKKKILLQPMHTSTVVAGLAPLLHMDIPCWKKYLILSVKTSHGCHEKSTRS